MFPWTVFKNADRQLKSAIEEGCYSPKITGCLFFGCINKAKLAEALDAGAEPDLCVEWVNTGQGGTWKIPVLIAATLQVPFSTGGACALDVEAADLLLGAGADPHQKLSIRLTPH